MEEQELEIETNFLEEKEKNTTQKSAPITKRNFLVSGSRGELKFWNLEKKECFKTLNEKSSCGWIYSLIFLPKQNYLVGACENGLLRIWGDPQYSPTLPNSVSLVENFQLLFELKKHTQRVLSLILLAEDEDLEETLSVSTASIIQNATNNSQTNPQNGSAPQTSPLPSPTTPVVSPPINPYSNDSSDRQFIASCSEDKRVVIWDVMKRTMVTEFSHNDGVTSITLLRSNILLSGTIGCEIFAWDLRTLKLRKKWKAHSDVIWAIIRITNEKFATASTDKTIKIWKNFSETPLRVLKGHKDSVFSLAKLDMNTIASSSGDAEIRIWNIHTAKCESIMKGHEGDIEKIIFLKDISSKSILSDPTEISEAEDCPEDCGGRLIASASADLVVNIWDCDKKMCVTKLKEHKDSIESLCIISDRENSLYGYGIAKEDERDSSDLTEMLLDACDLDVVYKNKTIKFFRSLANLQSTGNNSENGEKRKTIAFPDSTCELDNRDLIKVVMCIEQNQRERERERPNAIFKKVENLFHLFCFFRDVGMKSHCYLICKMIDQIANLEKILILLSMSLKYLEKLQKEDLSIDRVFDNAEHFFDDLEESNDIEDDEDSLNNIEEDEQGSTTDGKKRNGRKGKKMEGKEAKFGSVFTLSIFNCLKMRLDEIMENPKYVEFLEKFNFLSKLRNYNTLQAIEDHDDLTTLAYGSSMKNFKNNSVLFKNITFKSILDKCFLDLYKSRKFSNMTLVSNFNQNGKEITKEEEILKFFEDEFKSEEKEKEKEKMESSLTAKKLENGISVHREVLIRKSKFFSKMFSFGGKEKISLMRESKVEIEILNEKELYFLVEKIYTEKMNTDDLEVLLKLLEHSEKFMEKQLKSFLISKLNLLFQQAISNDTFETMLIDGGYLFLTLDLVDNIKLDFFNLWNSKGKTKNVCANLIKKSFLLHSKNEKFSSIFQNLFKKCNSLEKEIKKFQHQSIN